MADSPDVIDLGRTAQVEETAKSLDKLLEWLDPDKKAIAIIDGNNCYMTSRALNFDIDYKMLFQALFDRCDLKRAYYFTALHDGVDEYSPLRPLVDWMEYNNYKVIRKPVKQFNDASGRPTRMKGNMDVEITVYMMNIATKKTADVVFLFSGDGDFRMVVEHLQNEGLTVVVISTVKTQPAMCADELRRQADRFIDLQELAPHITRKPDPGRATRRESYSSKLLQSDAGPPNPEAT